MEVTNELEWQNTITHFGSATDLFLLRNCTGSNMMNVCLLDMKSS